MKFALYRRMSIVEAEKTLDNKCFFLPTDGVGLVRKWFSTSLFKTHYFKSPFYNGESVIIEVSVNEEYYNRIFSDGKFISFEPKGFAGFDDGSEDILYAKAHKHIYDLFNIGIRNIEDLNNNIISIKEIDDDYYCTCLEEETLNGSFKEMCVKFTKLEPTQFFVQVSYDVAILMVKYQTLLFEGINPILKKLHFSKELESLKKLNLNKYSVTLVVTFSRDLKNYSLFNEKLMSLDSSALEKFSRKVVNIVPYEILELKNDNVEFIDLRGSNLYTKHKKREFKEFENLTYSEFEKITQMLMSVDFKINSLYEIIPNLKDLEDINQVDPRHIDNLKTHIEKSVNISNFVLNYLKGQGFLFSVDEIVFIKWELFLHDLGKPYCSCEYITSRYSQFGDKNKYLNNIIDSLFDKDYAFQFKIINKLFHLSSLMGSRRLKTLIKELLENIKDFYNFDNEQAFLLLVKYFRIVFACKVSHSASLKTRAFNATYVDDLQFFDKVSTILVGLRCNGFKFDYDNFYYDLDSAYHDIVKDFYMDEEKNTMEMVRNLLHSDYNDLTIIYDLKKELHEIDDDKQYCYDEIICHYFMKDNELLKKYLSEKVSDNVAHGVNHMQRVGVISYVLSRLKGLLLEDIEILLISSIYHDKGRIFKNGVEHGKDSVDMLLKYGTLDGYINSQYVYFLIEAHAYSDDKCILLLDKYDIEREKALYLLSIFKDADALDRIRYDCLEKNGSALNIDSLRNEESKHLVKFSYMLNCQYKSSKKALAPSMMKLVKENKIK